MNTLQRHDKAASIYNKKSSTICCITSEPSELSHRVLTCIVLCARILCLLSLKLTSIRSQDILVNPLIITSSISSLRFRLCLSSLGKSSCVVDASVVSMFTMCGYLLFRERFRSLGSSPLLRMKQMLDAKVSEAELTASSQKKKIDELEAQLHEAEDIVRDLREELGEVKSELERVKSDKAQCLEKSYITTHGQLAEFRPQELYSGSIFLNTVVNASNYQRNAAHNCYGTSIYGGHPDLPSIISRRKEPLFYRNGCTHRIRACEKDRLDQELSLSTSINKTKDEMSIKEVEGAKETCNPQRQENENRKNSNQKVISDNIFGESTRTDQALPCLSPNFASDDAHSSEHLSSKGELSMNLVNCSTDQGMDNKHGRLTSEVAQQNMEWEESLDIIDSAKGSRSPIELEPNKSEIGNYLPKPAFKYTFQRKRKRDSSVNENASLENNLPEEHVPVESNNILDGNCGLENVTSLGNGTTKVRTSGTITDPGKTRLSRDMSEEQKTSIDFPKSSWLIKSPQGLLGLQPIAHQLISSSEK